MAYPPDLPPNGRSDSTLMAGAHAQDHNKIRAALADLIAELGANPSGNYADLTSRLLGMASGQDPTALATFLATAGEAKAARDQAAAIALGDADAALAGAVNNPASATRVAMDGKFAPISRRFVVFGDSWGQDAIDGVNIPTAAIAKLGGTIVGNYAISGSQLAPTTYGTEPTKRTDAQVATAGADNSVNKARVTDVLVIVGVNNIGGYLPTVTEAKGLFNAMGNLYPNARLWYAANSKKGINNAGDNDPWRWYNRFFEGASLAGFAVAAFSPMWNWGANRSTYWAAGPDSDRHMIAAGQTAYANRLAGFLAGGEGWRPHFKVPLTLHPNATTLVPGAALAINDTVVDGTTLKLRAVVTGMDSLSALSATSTQALLQIPTEYAPIGNYLIFPAMCRLPGGARSYAYGMEVVGGGVVNVQGNLLNDHEAFFVLNADLPLATIKTAD